MRIIRDASQEIEKKIICNNCGVELGYLPVDVKQKTQKDYGGGTDIVKSIQCANCQTEITV
jgi:hypothetical protein